VQQYGVIVFATEMYQWQFSPVGSSLPFVFTDCPASESAAQTQFELLSRLLPQNKAAIVACVAPHIARTMHLASPVVNKKKSGRKLYSSHAWSWERRELSMSKFSLWLTYSTFNNAKKTQQKININYTTTKGYFNFIHISTVYFHEFFHLGLSCQKNLSLSHA